MLSPSVESVEREIWLLTSLRDWMFHQNALEQAGVPANLLLENSDEQSEDADEDTEDANQGDLIHKL